MILKKREGGIVLFGRARAAKFRRALHVDVWEAVGPKLKAINRQRREDSAGLDEYRI